MKTFHVTTFGCQMNEHDSERMKGMLESLGYAEVPERGEADLILFNTCSIRERADERFVGHLREAAALKRRDPERVIGVGGCWAQSVKEQVFREFPFVDVAFGPGQVHKLAEFLTADSLTAQGFFEFEGFTGHLPSKRERAVSAWVQISAGCNMKCSYCIVPSTRGRDTSRPRVDGTMQYEHFMLQPAEICTQADTSRSRLDGRCPVKPSNSKKPCAVSESAVRNSASL